MKRTIESTKSMSAACARRRTMYRPICLLLLSPDQLALSALRNYEPEPDVAFRSADGKYLQPRMRRAYLCMRRVYRMLKPMRACLRAQVRRGSGKRAAARRTEARQMTRLHHESS